VTTIAQGEVPNFFVQTLPTIPFGNEDFVLKRAGQATLVPYSNPFSNIGTHPDFSTVSEGGALRAVHIARDGSVVATNRAGGRVMVQAEKHAELVPFNKSPVPLSRSQNSSQPAKQFSPTVKGRTAAASIILGILLLL